MSGPTIERTAITAAIAAWRDDASLSAIAMMHTAAADAMRIVDERLESVPMTDAITASEATAKELVRPVMRTHIAGAVDRWFKAQSKALRACDPRFVPVARTFARMTTRPIVLEADAGEAGGWSLPAWVRASIDYVGPALDYGIKDWVRVAARTELTRNWLGPRTDDTGPQPYLTELLDRIDYAAEQAREIAA